MASEKNDICCFLMRPRTGILIFIYTKMMLYLVTFIIMGIMVMEAYAKRVHEFEKFSLLGIMGIQFCVVLAVLLTSFLIELPFNICGLAGAHKENLPLLNAYFNFLIVSTCLQILRLGWAVYEIKLKADFPWILINILFNAYMLFVVDDEKARLKTKAATWKTCE